MFFVVARVGIQRAFTRKLWSTNDVAPLQCIRQTIYATSSGQGRAAITIVRISGPHTANCVQRLCMSEMLPKARYATVKKIWNPATRVLIDRCLVLWFPRPNSYTGEDSAEIHIHGSLAVQYALFDALTAMPHVRQAHAGEFTRRAFDNDKLDLTEVEGLADLLQAETEAQRKQALSQATGGLVAKYQEWQSMLVSQMVRLEADIDFAEVDDFKIVQRGVYDVVETITADMERHLADSVCAERVRVGCRTAFIGEPNVGKSSLLNQITQRNLAIVSAHAGTTTDVLEASLDMGGYPVTLCDTAGLRGPARLIRLRTGRELTLAKRELRRSRKLHRITFGNPRSVEQEGMQRARGEIERADLLLVVVDASLALQYASRMGNDATVMDYMNIYYEALIKAPHGCAELETASDKAYILIFNKIDLIPDDKRELFTSTGELCVSSRSGFGLNVLQTTIVEQVEKLCDGPRCTTPRLSKKRHRQHVGDALRCLRLFQTSSTNSDRAVLAGTLNTAIAALELMTGDTCKESMLDELFDDFCIGK